MFLRIKGKRGFEKYDKFYNWTTGGIGRAIFGD